MSANIELSIVIITRNRKSVLAKCLNSLYKYTKGINYELILVDNSSEDDTIRISEEIIPDIKIIRNSKNNGVGPARNQGLSIARGKYLLLLDDDTELIENSFKKMIAFIQTKEDCYIVGPKLIYRNGELQYSCRRDSSPLTVFFRRTQISKYFKKSRILYQYLMLDYDHKTPMEVGWVQGACLLMRREVIDNWGLLKNWFHGPEDQEICWRVRVKGKKVYYFPLTSVIHDYSRISANGINKFTIIQIYETLKYFILRYFYNFFKFANNNAIK